jgi:hypothetical protein
VTTRKEAAEKGERIYDYKPCRQCGDVRRYTLGGACPTCLAKRVSVYKDEIKRSLKKAEAKNKIEKDASYE